MSGDVELRGAGPDDANLLLTLIHEAFSEYVGRIDPPSGALNDTIEKIRGNLDRGHAVIASVDGVVAGCVFYDIEPRKVYLYRLSVLPAYRRRGIGGTLIGHVEEIAKAHFLPVHLGVRTGVPENRAYYERRGYRFIENYYHPGYTEPTWAMLERRWE